MRGSRKAGGALGAARRIGLIVAAAATLVLPTIAFDAVAADGELTKADLACLKCHDKPGLDKPLGDGGKLSLHISTKSYLDSMHNTTSCEDCHTEIDNKTHGKEKTPLKNKRELSLSMRTSCTDCHKERAAQYNDSIHAAMLADSGKKAALCSDCHNPHTLRSVKIDVPMAETPCAGCHEDIYKAYEKDVHGLLRAEKGKKSPLCADCHRAHDVKPPSLGEHMKDACIACHKDADAKHKDWLPNAPLHFEAISCAACHAPTAQRRVNLRLFDAAAGRQMSEKKGVPRFEKRAQAADTANVGLDERALWGLLKEFNEDGATGKTVLRGRLEVRAGIDAHRISEKAKALKDCDACHRHGAEPFQSVTLTIAGADGRPLRHGVKQEVLTSLTSMESVRGFYALGATRIKLLDHLLVLVMLGSIGGPLAHMTVKWLSGRARAKREAEAGNSRAPQDMDEIK